MHSDLVNVLRSKVTGVDRVLIVGLGNVLRGDDGLGIYVARKLKRSLRGSNNVKVLVCEGGLENSLDIVLKYKPKCLIIIDAVYREGDEPGSIYLLSEGDLASNVGTLSTHYIPLSDLIKMIRSYIDVEVLVIGIQVKNVEVGIGLSDEVLRASNYVVETIEKAIKNQ